MTPPTTRPRILGLHQADALALALLSGALFALGLLLLRELWAGALNRVELDAVIGAAVALGLIQLWLSVRVVLAMTLWAASGAMRLADAPWTVPVWWLGTLPAGWLGLVFPGHQHEPGFLVLSLVIIARSASALTRAVQTLEARVIGAA
jgi:hypothetical protein